MIYYESYSQGCNYVGPMVDEDNVDVNAQKLSLLMYKFVYL